MIENHLSAIERAVLSRTERLLGNP